MTNENLVQIQTTLLDKFFKKLYQDTVNDHPWEILKNIAQQRGTFTQEGIQIIGNTIYSKLSDSISIQIIPLDNFSFKVIFSNNGNCIWKNIFTLINTGIIDSLNNIYNYIEGRTVPTDLLSFIKCYIDE